MKSNQEMLRNMLQMQHDYDEQIFQAHRLSGYGAVKYRDLYLAIMDELGEYNHERKSEWCWWKKRQKDLDPVKTLEELVDVIHFLLMLYLKGESGCDDPAGRRRFYVKSFAYHLKKNHPGSLVNVTSAILDGQMTPDHLAYGLAGLINESGFPFAEVFEAYIRKNEINRQRIREGY